MTNLLVTDIDNNIIDQLKIHAEAKGCSVEELAKDLITQSMATKTTLNQRKAFLKKAEELRRKAGPQKSDSSELIRQDRDA